MHLLITSLVALGLGPLLHRLFRGREQLGEALDGFNVVAILGLLLLGIIPEALERGGGWVLAFGAIGMLGPTLMEANFHRIGRGTHVVALAVGILGLAGHSLVDGAALLDGAGAAHAGHSHSASESHLGLAVALHRVPVGLTIWLLLRPRYGRRVAAGVLGIMAASTVAGFFLGSVFTSRLSGAGLAYFEALVAGTLMHVVLHRPHEHGSTCCHEPRRLRRAAGAGGVLGLGFLHVELVGAPWAEPGTKGNPLFEGFLDLSLQSAPALLVGYLLAGFMAAYLPASSIRWLRRGHPWSQSLKGMIVGLPVPICSCGVVPLYRALTRRGVPLAAGMAFLVATPELGVDAVLLSLPLLGTKMTVLRVVAAALVAFLVGWLFGRISRRHAPPETGHGGPGGELESGEFAESDTPAGRRFRAALQTGLVEVVDHTAPWIIVGIFVAALCAPYLEESWLANVPDSLQVLLFAALGVPTYVCASGATPLVAVLLASSISPGAAIAFLLTGPATNATTFGVLGRLHGRRIALVFSVAVTTLAVLIGLTVNVAFEDVGAPFTAAAMHPETHLLNQIALAALALVFLASLVRRGPRRFLGEIFRRGEEDEPGSAVLSGG